MGKEPLEGVRRKKGELEGVTGQSEAERQTQIKAAELERSQVSASRYMSGFHPGGQLSCPPVSHSS